MADGSTSPVRIGPDGAELDDLVPSLRGRGRRMVGLAGPPGAGKSTLAAALVSRCPVPAVVVAMDGFHLADVELVRQGLLDRKGAPETFDGWGYAALLRRLRDRSPDTVYAPGFDRSLEQPLAGAVAVPPEVEVVVTEGNYLLLDTGAWPRVKAQLDEVWFVETDESLRLQRLAARHVAFGKTAQEARAWVDRVDGPNATLVVTSRQRADLIVDLTAWVGFSD